MAKRKADEMSSSGVTVMMNGLPGAMGHEISQCCIRRGVDLASVAMTGPNMPAECEVKEGDKCVKVRLVGPKEDQKAALAKAKEEYKNLIVIDFTHPTAVNPNSDIYTALQVPYVMGTTGGDRDKLMKVTKDSGTYALIAPNMCKQIVAFQATLERMSTEFPGAFGGYDLDITESHQSTKADTSGTAKAMVGSFNGLGVKPFGVDQINKIRLPEKQKEFGVPESFLDGHAWHTYTLTSDDGSVQFAFKHNVNGRRTYAEGVVDGLLFLADKIKAGTEKKVYNMIDVLSEGKMK